MNPLPETPTGNSAVEPTGRYEFYSAPPPQIRSSSRKRFYSTSKQRGVHRTGSEPPTEPISARPPAAKLESRGADELGSSRKPRPLVLGGPSSPPPPPAIADRRRGAGGGSGASSSMRSSSSKLKSTASTSAFAIAAAGIGLDREETERNCCWAFQPSWSVGRTRSTFQREPRLTKNPNGHPNSK
jgi:hypothetical protein